MENLCQALRDAALERALVCLEEETEAEAKAEEGSARSSRANGRVRRDAAVDGRAASVEAWMCAGGGGAGGDAGDGQGYGRWMAEGEERAARGGGRGGRGVERDDGRVGLQDGVAPMLLVPLIGLSTAVAVAVVVGWVRR